MDCPQKVPNLTHTQHNNKPRIKGFILGCSLTLLSSISLLFFLAHSILSYIPNPVSIDSQCRILSTNVDLRSSKVCDLGFLNYKAKNVFYPSSQSSKFRCRYDYYWASVFKVEYREYSGQTLHALAEAPKEALPVDCRPSFGVAWLTKEKFKVNETYKCRYTPGLSKVDLYSDSFFNCHAKDPSIAEMIRRYFILLTRTICSSFFGEGRPKIIIQDLLAGLVAGVFTALVSIVLIKPLLSPKSRLAKNPEPRKSQSEVLNRNHMKQVSFRVCSLIVYLSLMGWFMIQYGKLLGLTEIFTTYY